MRYVSLLIAISLVLTLASCTTASDGIDTMEKLPMIAVTDQAGREVVVEQPVERIVSGYYISTSVCIALGLADRLVGIEARAETRPIYSLAAPALLDLPNVGTARDFNLEACLALSPDLVVLPIRLQDAADTLTDMGVPVILLNPESHDEVLEMISIIGAATGADHRAGRLLNWYYFMLEDIKSQTVAISYTPSVYITGNGSWLTTAPGDMFQSSLVEAAGGMNVAEHITAGGRVEVSYEELLVMNPEVIIIPSEADFGIDDILADAQLTELDAVKSGRIYKMPSDFEAWDSPIPAAMLGAKWLLSVLHEGLVGADELEQDIADFYKEFYNVE